MAARGTPPPSIRGMTAKPGSRGSVLRTGQSRLASIYHGGAAFIFRPRGGTTRALGLTQAPHTEGATR